MFNLIKQSIILLLVVPMMACAADKSSYREGTHFFELPKEVRTDDASKIEVRELFWYGCGGCFMVEPLLKRWLPSIPGDVNFVRMPATLNSRWEVHARAYYTAETLGVVDTTHQALFDALHEQRRNLFTKESLAKFYAGLGVDEAAFNKTFESFAVNSRIQKAKSMQMAYRATGVPAFIVNGKYRVPAQEDMLKVVDYLVAKERQQGG